MAMITPDTFDPLHSYISVRLLQGVPLVDADWNEAHDVRKFEVQAFLKWFVGNGVPEGNDDGFRIASLTSVRVKEDDPPVWDFVIQCGVVGQVPDGTSPVERGLRHVGRCLVDGMDVLIAKDINFRAQKLHVSQGGVATALASLLGVPTIAEIPVGDDPVVVYLDVWERLVTPDEEPGLVHSGLGVESSARLKREWVVRARAGSSVPTPTDPSDPDDPNHFIAGHSYYALATIAHQANVPITDEAITDQRERRLLMPPATLLEDLFGPVDYRRGQGRPIVNLREAINALLRGELPMSPELLMTTTSSIASVFLKDSYEDIWAFWQNGTTEIWYKRYSWASDSWGNDTKLTTDPRTTFQISAVEDRAGGIWVFWISERGGAVDRDIWYKRYSRASDSWENDTKLTTDPQDSAPFALADRAGDIWVFWMSTRSGNFDIWYKRYSHTSDSWGNDTQLTTDLGGDYSPFALADRAGDIWVFWYSQRGTTDLDIRYKRYSHTSDSWGNDTQLTTDLGSDSAPFALVDRAGDIWVFWMSTRSGKFDIWYKRYSQAIDRWGNDTQLTTDPEISPFLSFALADRAGDIWVFWQSGRMNTDPDIWYKRYSRGSWGNDTQLTTDPELSSRPIALADRSGTIWVFWSSGRRGTVSVDIRYRKMFLAL
jgi:hypothetical protein